MTEVFCPFQSAFSGEWIAEFPAMKSGGPCTIVLSGAEGSAPVILDDVLVGEVWYCTGQSNMEMPVDSDSPFWFTTNAKEEVTAAMDQPQLVRYAFVGFCRVNLINREGWPALPFRSDAPDYGRMFR